MSTYEEGLASSSSWSPSDGSPVTSIIFLTALRLILQRIVEILITGDTKHVTLFQLLGERYDIIVEETKFPPCTRMLKGPCPSGLHETQSSTTP
jgi:hypothetical protein